MCVTTKLEVPREHAVLVMDRVVMVLSCQLDCLWRVGLHFSALADLRGTVQGSREVLEGVEGARHTVRCRGEGTSQSLRRGITIQRGERGN